MEKHPNIAIELLQLLARRLEEQESQAANRPEELVVVCSHCRRVRQEDGSWVPLESLVHQRTGMEFSHGICPDCRQEHYPKR